jgi:hypothetical protein
MNSNDPNTPTRPTTPESDWFDSMMDQIRRMSPTTTETPFTSYFQEQSEEMMNELISVLRLTEHQITLTVQDVRRSLATSALTQDQEKTLLTVLFDMIEKYYNLLLVASRFANYIKEDQLHAILALTKSKLIWRSINELFSLPGLPELVMDLMNSNDSSDSGVSAVMTSLSSLSLNEQEKYSTGTAPI